MNAALLRRHLPYPTLKNRQYAEDFTEIQELYGSDRVQLLILVVVFSHDAMQCLQLLRYTLSKTCSP